MTTGSRVTGTIDGYGLYNERTWTGSDDPLNHKSDNPYTLHAAQGFNPTVSVVLKNQPNTIYHSKLFDSEVKRVMQPDLWTSNDVIVLANKLRRQVRTHDFNAGNVLGEHHQTLRMIGDTARNIAMMLKQIKKGNLSGAAKAIGVPLRGRDVIGHKVDSLATGVLQLQYGWRPLLSDVFSGAEAVASIVEKPIATSARASRKKTNSGLLPDGQGFGAELWSVTEHKQYVIVRFKQRESVTASLGLENPLGVAWEVLPWSFVADWFLPIGPYLEAVGAMRSFVFDKVIISDVLTKECYVVAGGLRPTYKSFTGWAGGYLKQCDFTRSVGTTFAVPLPTVKPLKDALSFEHCINGLALLAGGRWK